MQYAIVIGTVLLSFLLSLLQLAALPFLALAMFIQDSGTSLALARAWVVQLGSLTAPFVVPFITQRSGDSVRWRIYNTLDDPGQTQGMNRDVGGAPVPGKFQQQVQDVYDNCGWAWKTYYWLAGRNVCYGLANLFRPAYDFSNLKFSVSGSESGLQTVAATWLNGSAREYRLFLKIGSVALRLCFGYKLAESYLDTTYPEVKINSAIDTNPSTDVGGVPFLTMRLQ